MNIAARFRSSRVTGATATAAGEPPGRDDASERAQVRRLKAEVARLSGLAARFLAAYPGAAGEVRWAVEELTRVNAGLDGHLKDLRSRPPGGVPPGPGPE